MTEMPIGQIEERAASKVDKAHAVKRFEEIFPLLVEELISHLHSTGIPGEAIEWFKKNTMGGKLNRGLSVVDSYQILAGQPLDEATYMRVSILGWTVELLQAYFLVADDIMDQSKTRRGQPCWYRMDGVGNIAINDAFMIESTIYFLLKKHFKQEPYYVDLLELFHEVTFQTELGQHLDLLIAPEDQVDLDKFSLDRHLFIITYKTAFYSFYLPVALPMYMSGISDPRDLKAAEDVLVELGRYFQVQDDYLDCFGHPDVIGKIGTDIFDNKCSWLINMALKKANKDQRQVFDENYGRKDTQAEAAVKEVYNELKLAEEYAKYEEQIVGKITKMIEEVDESRGFKKEVLREFLRKVYKRSK